MKVDILAIGIHPDDVELSASGTLLKHQALGYSFGILDLSKGELGTRGTAETRAEEAALATAILRAQFRRTLDIPDGMFVHSEENWRKIIQIIRWCQPDIILCNAPDDRHPDHGRASKLVIDACFYAGLVKIETVNDTGTLQAPWRPKSVYSYIQDKQLEPDFVVDITPYFPKKMEAILAYKTQFHQETPENGPNTPISGKDFIDFIDAKAKVFGRPIQANYAEGFIINRTPGVENLFDLR